VTPPSSDPLPMHIATRGSRLALWQANTTRELLGEEHELLIVRSSGDADRTTDLARFGSIGIFTVEVDRAILDGRARIGVHSLKDMTTTLQDGIVLAGCLARGPVEDVLVSRDGRGLRDLPSGSRVGTGSLRRGAMIRTLRSDVEVVSQRGNVPTRVSHVVDGDLDACVLARAGLERLGLAEHVAEVLSLDDFLPAVGQGIVGITCREDDHEVRELLGERVRDPLAWPCALRERAAETMALVCAKFGEQYPTIQPRITRTLVKALLDPAKPLATHYGAVVGLAALGPRVTRLLILPHLRQVLETLEPMLAEGEEDERKTRKNEGADEDAAKSAEKTRRRRRDARRVHDALKRAVGACLHAALAVPSAEANAASEPERRAARKKTASASGSVGPPSSAPGAGSVAGWKIGKAPGTLRVDVAGAETEIAIGDAVLSDTSEDPKAVAAKVAAAAALLGDCVVPYAAVPEAAGAFI